MDYKIWWKIGTDDLLTMSIWPFKWWFHINQQNPTTKRLNGGVLLCSTVTCNAHQFVETIGNFSLFLGIFASISWKYEFQPEKVTLKYMDRMPRIPVLQFIIIDLRKCSAFNFLHNYTKNNNLTEYIAWFQVKNLMSKLCGAMTFLFRFT